MYNRGQFRTARYNSIRQYHNLFTSAKQTPALVHSVTKIGSPMEVGQILSTRHACHHEELQTLLEVSACLTELYTLCVSIPVPVYARLHTSRLYYILYHLHIYTLCKFKAWPQKTLLLTWRFFFIYYFGWSRTESMLTQSSKLERAGIPHEEPVHVSMAFYARYTSTCVWVVNHRNITHILSPNVEECSCLLCEMFSTL